jgi:hypothetical protein
MISRRVFGPSTPNRCRHLVLTRLKKISNKCMACCLRDVVPELVPASMTRGFHERVVVSQCSSSKRCPKFFDVAAKRIEIRGRSVGDRLDGHSDGLIEQAQ